MATLYISPTGSGSGDGSSIANAGTLANLNDFIGAAGPDGRVVLIADQGAYSLSERPPSITTGGTEGHPVTVQGMDSFGNVMKAAFEGSRAEPFNPKGAVGEEVFRLLDGADNLSFKDMSFTNIGYGAFRVGADLSNLSIEHMEATNVQRFFEDYPSGISTTATISGLTIRDVQVEGFSRGVIRIAYDSHDILIEDVRGDSQRQDESGSAFAIGVHLEGSVHDVVLRRVTMRNAEDHLSGTFWNGDGFTTESRVYNVLFEDTVSTGNVDAGYDLKSSTTTLIRAMAEDNGRNFRIWAKDTVLQDIVSIEPDLRGGNSSQHHVWFGRGAQASVIDAVLSDHATTAAFGLLEGSAIANVTNLVAMIGPTAPLFKTLSNGHFYVDTVNYGSAVTSVSYAGALDPVVVHAHDDSDHVIVGGEAGDVLRGEAGNDQLQGGGGADVLIGGAGDDLLLGGAGGDVLLGGSGYDIASYADAAAGVQVDLLSGAPGGGAAGDLLEGVEGLIGSAFGDVLRGDHGANLIAGGAGDDTIDGRRGNDVLAGGAGADIIIGGEGADVADYSASVAAVTVNLATGLGAGGDAQGDRLSGIETLVGSAFGDTLIGGNGDDRLIGGGGADQLIGGGGTDTADYSGNAVGIAINLGTGVSAGGDAAGDQISGIEIILGSSLADDITGDGNANTLIGGLGDDRLDGAGGDDLLIGGAGADRLIGGTGFDTADYSGNAAAVTVNLTSGVASGGDANGDQLQGVERVIGTIFGDVLIGDAQANTLEGGEGDDRLTGGGGADQLIGGAGTDIADYSTSSSGITLDLAGGASAGDAVGDQLQGIEIVVGSAHADTIIAGGGIRTLDGAGGADNLIGSAADEVLIGGAGGDMLDGGGGIDAADYSTSGAAVSVDLALGLGSAGDAAGDRLQNIENLTGSVFADVLRGNALANILVGGAGADQLFGGGGFDIADYRASAAGVTVNLATGAGSGGDAQGDTLAGIAGIFGSRFDDHLTGDAADNLFVGGAGADTLEGGGGIDIADYSASNAAVTVNLLTNINSGGDAAGDSLGGIENLVGTAFDDLLTGNGGANRLEGGDGNDTLDGGGGADMLIGGAGDDRYIVDSAGDVVVEGVDGGGDRVGTTLSTYTLGANVEALAYDGVGDFIGYGNDGNNVFYGSTGSETFYGYLGDDNMQGSLGADIFYGGEGKNEVDYSKAKVGIVLNLLTNVNVGGDADGDKLYDINQVSLSSYDDDATGDNNNNVLYGRGGIDVLRGMGGNDKLDGGSGIDTLIGGLGDDNYVVDNPGDQTIELAGEGIDQVGTALSAWTLADNIENLTTSSVNIFTGIGNGLDNNIRGNSNNDLLYGLDGDDTLQGRDGSDQLFGGAGSDTASYALSFVGVTVNLGTGFLQGGDAQGDVLDSIENLTGSAFADTLTGDAGANRLDGGAGDDVLDGGAGIDTLRLSGSRNDYLFSYVGGVLTVHDYRSPQPDGTGFDGTDKLFNIERVEFAEGYPKPLGIIESGPGDDTLTGTAAADNFFFDTGLGMALGKDAIRNFGAGDRIITTSPIYDSNNDGKIGFGSSDRLALPSTIGAAPDISTGSIKVYTPADKVVSTIKLLDTVLHDGTTFYVYGAWGDAAAQPGLDFDTATPPVDPPVTLPGGGTPGPDNLTGDAGANIIEGGGGDDVIAGLAGNDRLTGGAGNDAIDGGADIDTLVLGGARGDYGFASVGGALTISDLRPGAPDGTDGIANIEQIEYLGGAFKPLNTLESGFTSETLWGTAAQDVFLFDTAQGLGLGTDGIMNFGPGDRIVTTSPIYDSNNDGRIGFNSSDKLGLPGTIGGPPAETTGTLKIYNMNGKVVSSVVLDDVVTDHGVTYYVYGASGDPVAHVDLLF